MIANARTREIADEHDIDLQSLQKGVYLVKMEDLLRALEQRTSGAFARVPTRLRAPQFVPDVTQIRDYQWKAVDAMFRRTGFIISPCGSGKTLIGCLAAVLNGGRFLVLTTRYINQWKDTMERFFKPIGVQTRIFVTGSDAPVFASGDKLPAVVISTYATFSASNERYRILKKLVYDTVVLDEAHTAAAKTHLQMIDQLYCIYAYGLTATNVREDDELQRLEKRFGINPIKWVIDRRMLVSKGFVADCRVLHLVVPCPSTGAAARLCGEVGKPIMLALHPHKVQVLLHAVSTLCSESHKVIVFCDDLFGLSWISRIARDNGIPNVGDISMHTPEEERQGRLRDFSMADAPVVIFMSRTGDEAVDLPSASAGVVWWNNWQSRRQIVQRIGRVCRPQKTTMPIFLILLADDPKEMAISNHRQTYLTEHGFVSETFAHNTTPYGVDELKSGDRYVEELICAKRRLSEKSSSQHVHVSAAEKILNV